MTKENDDIAIYNFTCGKQNLTKEMNNIHERFSFWEEGVFSFMSEAFIVCHDIVTVVITLQSMFVNCSEIAQMQISD